MRLFLAGGPRGEEVMLGSSAPADGGAAPEGPDIGLADICCPEARLLFREPVGEEGSGLREVSAGVGRAWEGEIPGVESCSCLSARLDIADDGKSKTGDSEVQDV